MTKNDIAAWLRKKVTAELVAVFVAGVLIGLVVLGWWLLPVQWTNADPSDLRPAEKETYVQMIADSYSVTGDVGVARGRLAVLKGPQGKDTYLTGLIDGMIRDRTKAGDGKAVVRLQGLASVLRQMPPTGPIPGSAGWIWAGSTGQALRLLGILFFLVLFAAGIALLLTQLRKRESVRRRRPAPAPVPPGEPTGEPPEQVAPPPGDKALACFETTYNEGDEGYDVSYSIESPSGEFLGECGMSAVEDVGMGQADQVSAFEVWLFDKDAVRTETKVLVSERAFGDTALHAKLTSKGEIVPARLHEVVTLETANLHLNARVVELRYTEGSESGVFAKLTTQLDVARAEPAEH